MEQTAIAKSLQNILELSQKQYDNTIYLKIINTPLGSVYACSFNDHICFLDFTDVEKTYLKLKSLIEILKARIIVNDTKVLQQLSQELEEYFDKNRQQFSVPLYLCGTDFQKEVWNTLCTIPFGRFISYKEQAILMKKAKTVRAVANANGKNKIAILIPCHRVIGTDNSLKGYSGGVWRKEKLLEIEQK